MSENRRRLLSSFDHGTYQQFVHVDPEKPDNLIVETLEDCEPIIERAKMLSELEPGKEFRHAAIIPHHVWDQACREGWQNDKARWKRWANDPDNKAFRTWPGRL